MRLHGIDKMLYNPVYVALVVLAVIPIDIWMMLTGQFVFGLILFAMQIPWAISGFMGKFEYTARLMGIDV